MIGMPEEYSWVGRFSGSDGYYQIEPGLFQEYIRKLREIANSHTLGGPFSPNGGSAASGYDWEKAPRATLEDDEGELELVIAAYGPGSYPATMSVYASDEERAMRMLRVHFTEDEFDKKQC